MSIESIENNAAPISVCRLTAASKNLPSLAGKGAFPFACDNNKHFGWLLNIRYNALWASRTKKVAKIRSIKKTPDFQGGKFFEKGA